MLPCILSRSKKHSSEEAFAVYARNKASAPNLFQGTRPSRLVNRSDPREAHGSASFDDGDATGPEMIDGVALPGAGAGCGRCRAAGQAP